MKFYIRTITFVFIAFAAVQCGPSAKEESQTKNVTTTSDETTTIQLNKGNKWLVNDAMKPFIQEEEIILNEYISTKSVDYKTLAAQLKEKNTGLIQSCTMQGESHDELHKWLHPHMELIKALAAAEGVSEAQTIIAQLQESYKIYKQYFQ